MFFTQIKLKLGGGRIVCQLPLDDGPTPGFGLTKFRVKYFFFLSQFALEDRCISNDLKFSKLK